jgi:type IX secretion system PorP/SprF family membrane protein
MKRIILVLIVLVVNKGLLLAQDPFFSQYFMSPMTVNPAMIGKGTKATRVMANHRSQWWGSSAANFVTNTVSAELPFAKGLTDKSQLALGVMGLSDVSNNGILKNNYFSAGMAYNQNLNQEGTKKFGAGLMATFGSRALDVSKMQWQSQFGSFGFNAALPSGENLQLPKRSYFDVAAGVHYSSEGKKWNVNLGASVFHVAQADISAFDAGNSATRMRFNLNMDLAYKFNGGDELHFISLATQYNTKSVLNVGAIYKYKINGDHMISRVNAGLMSRMDDAYVGYFALEAPKWSLGVSYDFIQSDVQTFYNSVQSMEVSFCTFLTSKKKNIKAPSTQFLY